MPLQIIVSLLALISSGQTSVRRVIPIDFNQSAGERQDAVVNYIQSQVVNMNDIISQISKNNNAKQQRKLQLSENENENHQMSVHNYQQRLRAITDESRAIKGILLTQKATMKAIKHIQECFTYSPQRKGKQLTVNGKDLQKLINLLRKDDYGLNNTEITVHEHGTLRVNSKVFHIKRSVKELVEEIRSIIEKNYGGTFEQICRDNEDLTYSLEQIVIEQHAMEHILRNFDFLEQERHSIELELAEINKALMNDTESIHILNNMLYQKQVSEKWNYAEIFEKHDFVKRYFAIKREILVMTQQWKGMIAGKQNQSEIKKCVQQLVVLRAEYNEQKPRIKQMVCEKYRQELILSVPELAAKLKTSLQHYAFQENGTTLQETIMYKLPLILSVNENKKTALHVAVQKVAFETMLEESFQPNVPFFVYKNHRGYTLYHSLNQAQKFVNNMDKLSSFWCDRLRIISFLKVAEAEQLLLCPAEGAYIHLTTVNHEFGQLLAWLNVFDVPWNNQDFGIRILIYFVEFTRYGNVRDFPDIRQSLLLWKEIGTKTKLAKVSMDIVSKTERENVSAWWFVLCKMGFSF